MSKVAIEGNALGTGTLTIAAPNTNTNRTITLPDATGTLALTGAASNKIEEGNSKVEVTDAGTGKVEITVDAVEVADFTTGAIVFNETGANQDFRVEGDSNANLIVADAGVDKVGIGTNTFNTNGGVLQVSNGISFPATQSALSDANTLDDYEEGAWTLSIGGTATYSGQAGQYTKIGNMVTVSGRLGVTLRGTGSQSLITGLPFTTTGSTNNYGGTVGFFTGLAVSIVYIYPLVDSATNNVRFNTINTARTDSLNTQNIIQDGTVIDILITYQVA